MQAIVLIASLVVGLFLSSLNSAVAQDRFALLTRAQTRAYHACLFEAWIQDYCHWHSSAYGQCVIANGGGKYPLEGRFFTEDYCWSTAQSFAPR